MRLGVLSFLFWLLAASSSGFGCSHDDGAGAPDEEQRGRRGAQSAPARPTTERGSAPASADALLEPVRRAHHLVGLSGAVVGPSGLLALGAAGQRRLDAPDPVKPDDPWHLGSDTKAMTATLAAILVEDGLVRWDTTLAAAFPSFAERIHPGYQRVTLAQLLTHRAGLTDRISREHPETWSRLWEARRPLPAERAWLAETLLAEAPHYRPGTFLYSNAGYIVAGAVLEGAAQAPWEELMRSRLFEPLGMASCGFGPAAAVSETDAPWGHKEAGGLEPVPPGPGADNPQATGPAGTAHCSLADWGKFIALHLRGARQDTALLPKAAFTRLHTPPSEPDDDGYSYAYGWGVVERPWAGGTALTHGGSNTMNFA